MIKKSKTPEELERLARNNRPGSKSMKKLSLAQMKRELTREDFAGLMKEFNLDENAKPKRGKSRHKGAYVGFYMDPAIYDEIKNFVPVVSVFSGRDIKLSEVFRDLVHLALSSYKTNNFIENDPDEILPVGRGPSWTTTGERVEALEAILRKGDPHHRSRIKDFMQYWVDSNYDIEWMRKQVMMVNLCNEVGVTVPNRKVNR